MRAIKTLPLILLLLVSFTATAQEYNPFKSIGKKGKIVTLSKGKYVEVFDYDSIQRIGTVLFNIRTKNVVKLLNAEETFKKFSDNSSASRWYSPDPLADNFAQYSPYNFVENNPINLIDPDGNAATPPGDYYNEKGEYLGNDGIDDNKVYVVKTTQTTTAMYGKDNYDQKGWTKPITTEAAAQTEQKIKDGTFDATVKQNVVQIQPEKNMEKMVQIVSKDDGTGGTKSANNQEYGGNLVNGVVKAEKSGPAGDPTKGKNASITNVDFHSHPSGTKKIPGAIAMWTQPPSKQDIQTAKKTEYVFGMKDNTIYIYNKSGVLATIPITTFKK